jgi:hypothetical protein
MSCRIVHSLRFAFGSEFDDAVMVWLLKVKIRTQIASGFVKIS